MTDRDIRIGDSVGYTLQWNWGRGTVERVFADQAVVWWPRTGRKLWHFQAALMGPWPQPVHLPPLR